MTLSELEKDVLQELESQHTGIFDSIKQQFNLDDNQLNRIFNRLIRLSFIEKFEHKSKVMGSDGHTGLYGYRITSLGTQYLKNNP